MINPIDALRGELIREGEANPNGGGWSDCVIQCLHPGHRDLRESLENIVSAGDSFTTPRQRSLARQALGQRGTSMVSRSDSPGEIDEMELLEALAGAL